MRDIDQLSQFEKNIGTRLTNKQVISELCNRLRDNIEVLYPHFHKNTTTIRGYSMGGQYAQTFRLVLSQDAVSVTIFAKLCPIFDSLDPAKKEYETLQSTYSQMKSLSDTCSVSRPLLYFNDLNCYMMESVGTKDLRTRLLKNNSIFSPDTRINDLKNNIKGSAEWLALFHKITASNINHSFTIKDYLVSFTDEFDYSELSLFNFKTPVTEELNKLFNAVSIKSVSFSVPLSRWHWDYTPGHVYLDNNRISVIDILGLENTPIYEDIGHFLASITSINNLPAYPFFNRRRSAVEFCDVFVTSYYLRSNLNKNEFLLLTSLYKLKYLIVYFLIQHRQVTQKIGSKAGILFTNIRTVRIFEEPIHKTISEIYNLLELQKS